MHALGSFLADWKSGLLGWNGIVLYAIHKVGKYSKYFLCFHCYYDCFIVAIFRTFPALILEKIHSIIVTKHTPLELRIRLLNLVADFRPCFLVTKNSLRLGRLLLKRNISHVMRIATYNAMTKIAMNSCWAVPKLVGLYSSVYYSSSLFRLRFVWTV